MPKVKISEYSTTNADNTDIEGINIAEGCAPSGINNAIRELMVHLKEFQTGASGDGFTFAGGTLMTGTNTLSGTNVLSGSTTAAFAAGTVSAPSIYASGDTNTGIFFPAADTIAFAEGGAEAMRITSTGEVLVGGTTAVISGKGAVTIEGTDTTAYLSLFRNDTSIDSGNALGQIRFYGNDTTTNTPTSLAYVYAVASGTHAAGDNPTDLTFGTTPDNSATVAEVVRFTQAGNVGIGTSSPTQRLEVYNSATNSQCYAVVQNNRSRNAGILIKTTNGGFYTGTSIGTDTLCWQVYDETNGERMRIDSSGNVGIGATPSAWSTVPAIQVSTYGGLSAGGGYTRLSSNAYLSTWPTTWSYINTSTASLYEQASGNHIWSTAASGTAGNAITFTERARITSGGYFKASGDGTYVSSTGAFHELKTSANNNCVRLANNIASGFGDAMLQCSFTGYTPNTTGAYFLYCSDPTNLKASILTTGTFESRTSTYGGVSDVKLKQDIVDASSQWDDIKNLRIRKFRFKDEVAVDPNYPSYIGLIAQEAELVSPGLVSETPDTEEVKKTREIEKTREVEVTPAVLDEEGNVVEPAVTTTETYTETEEYTEKVATGTVTKSVKYSILYMKAVKALQEAMERIETLEAQNAAFEARLAALEAK